jgi:hypothetical protein
MTVTVAGKLKDAMQETGMMGCFARGDSKAECTVHTAAHRVVIPSGTGIERGIGVCQWSCVN